MVDVWQRLRVILVVLLLHRALCRVPVAVPTSPELLVISPFSSFLFQCVLRFILIFIKTKCCLISYVQVQGTPLHAFPNYRFSQYKLSRLIGKLREFHLAWDLHISHLDPQERFYPVVNGSVLEQFRNHRLNLPPPPSAPSASADSSSTTVPFESLAWTPLQAGYRHPDFTQTMRPMTLRADEWCTLKIVPLCAKLVNPESTNHLLVLCTSLFYWVVIMWSSNLMLASTVVWSCYWTNS